jgi:tripartite-type tricarboxylate transporter receptor subunit TctC
VRDKLAAQFMTPIPGSADEFRARIDADIARWSPVITAAKIKIE